MDELPDSGSDAVTGDGGQEGTADRDLRDVLRNLVVAGDGREAVSVSDVAAAAGGSERLLPELLEALTDEATAVRIGAAWTLCALAEDEPTVVEYLTERVVERVDDGDEPFEVGQVLAFLRGRYPGRAAGAVDVAVDRSLEPSGGSERPDSAVDAGGAGSAGGAGGAGDPPEGTRIETDGGVPAGAAAKPADSGDGRRVVRPDGGAADVYQRPVEPGPGGPGSGPGGNGPTPGPDVPTDHPTHPDFDPDADGDGADAGTDAGTGAAGTAAETDTTPDPSAPPVTRDEHRPETPETFASVAALSGFDQLTAVAEGIDTRYASAYRCRAVEDGEERGVSVRLFDRADEPDRLEFCGDLEDCLARWQALGTGEPVVGVAEWGERPRPWVATEPVEETLADRDRPPVDEAFRQALGLAEAVGYVHRHGAVHAGIEPRTVVYPGDSLDPTAGPMLDSVGLMGPFRQHFQPAEYLDPRFAAPEYFDDSFGCIDAATDVYGLGAVCYLLFTGRPPATGSLAEIREQVVHGTPPAPSSVNDALPEGVDDVLECALATQKLTRYESVEGFYRDIERVFE